MKGDDRAGRTGVGTADEYDRQLHCVGLPTEPSRPKPGNDRSWRGYADIYIKSGGPRETPIIDPLGIIRYEVKGITSVAGAGIRRSDPTQNALQRWSHACHVSIYPKCGGEAKVIAGLEDQVIIDNNDPDTIIAFQNGTFRLDNRR